MAKQRGIQAESAISIRTSYKRWGFPWWSGNARMKPASTEQLRFVVNRKHVCEWYQCNSTLNGQIHGVLRKRHSLRCGQPLSVDLDESIWCNIL